MQPTRGKLLLLKTIHTIVWAAFVSMIGYILYSGIANRIGWFTYVSIAAVLLEGVVLLIFKWKCPITIVARRFSDEQEAGFDIFLPRLVAKHNKAIFTGLYAFGVVLVVLRMASFG